MFVMFLSKFELMYYSSDYLINFDRLPEIKFIKSERRTLMASIKKYYLKKAKQYRYEVFISNGINPGTGKQNKIHKNNCKTQC